MLRTSRENPRLSAHEDFEGKPFDFNKTPMAIIGCKALAFIDPEERGSWESHAADAFYEPLETGPYCYVGYR